MNHLHFSSATCLLASLICVACGEDGKSHRLGGTEAELGGRHAAGGAAASSIGQGGLAQSASGAGAGGASMGSLATGSIGTGGMNSVGGASTVGGAINVGQCGDGVLDQAEQCDDANEDSDDGCSATCQVEPGWRCRVAGRVCVVACGDGQLTEYESCDDGNDTSGDGCSATCQVEPGYSCAGTPSMCANTICGNGVIEVGESCDRGASNGLFYGDGTGCSRTCTREPNCRADGVTGACTTVCGDGNKDPNEPCDDGNQFDGDGCSSECKVEPGFTCADNTFVDTVPCSDSSSLQCLVLPVVYRDFDGQQVVGGHPDFFYLGASGPDGTKTLCVPNASGAPATVVADECTNTDSTAKCSGLVKNVLGSDGKPQLNISRADGLKCACRFTDWDETGILASAASATSCWDDSGNECKRVGYGTELMVQVIQDEASFKQWYTDSSASTTVKGTLELASLGADRYQFSSGAPEATAGAEGLTVYDDIHGIFLGTQQKLSSGFFPLEDSARAKVCNIWPYWLDPLQTVSTCKAFEGGDVASQWDPKGSYLAKQEGTGGPVAPVQGLMRNFYFTTEARYLFRYDGTMSSLAFFGNDDVWVFINGRLALDLGAPHERIQGTVAIDASYGLEIGHTYEIAVFHANRHPRESNFQLTLPGSKSIRTVCSPRCGDDIVTAGEECDSGT